MKAKKIILSSLAVASAGALAAGVYKIAKDQKRLRTQEELVAEVREQWGRLRLCMWNSTSLVKNA